MQSTINLLRPVKSNETQLVTIKDEIQKITFTSFIVSTIIGLITLLATVSFSLSRDAVLSTNAKLKKQLAGESAKESMLAVVKSRISVVDKAIAYSKPLDTALLTVKDTLSFAGVSAIQYDDSDKILIRVKPLSLEDTAGLFAGLLSLVDQKKIRNPKIDSFSLDKDGIQCAISFTALWENL